MRRRFADLPWGQVHYRTGGHGGAVPLLMLHGAGSNGAAVLPLAAAMAESRQVLLPDLPGCGDSDPLPGDPIEIADIARALLAVLDAIGVAECDVLGGHLGARLGIELALSAPGRIRRVILDGIGLYDDAGRAAMLARVAPTILPDATGDYLRRAHAMCTDYYRFFPWFENDAAHRRTAPPPDPRAVHAKLLEVLKNGATYAAPYHAAIRYRPEDRLPLVRQPVLIAANRGDNVAAQGPAVAALRPGAPFVETPGAASPRDTAAIFARFLDTPSDGAHP